MSRGILTKLHSLPPFKFQETSVAWITTLLEDFKLRINACFSVTMAALVFEGTIEIPSKCKGHRLETFSRVLFLLFFLPLGVEKEGKRWRHFKEAFF